MLAGLHYNVPTQNSGTFIPIPFATGDPLKDAYPHFFLLYNRQLLCFVHQPLHQTLQLALIRTRVRVDHFAVGNGDKSWEGKDLVAGRRLVQFVRVHHGTLQRQDSITIILSIFPRQSLVVGVNLLTGFAPGRGEF